MFREGVFGEALSGGGDGMGWIRVWGFGVWVACLIFFMKGLGKHAEYGETRTFE